MIKLVDAFVALGGNSDCTGIVKKQIILQVIKNEFDLKFDIEELIEKINESGEDLDYSTFCLLFTDEDGRRRSGSVLSVFFFFITI
jgi:hypothetical protein